MSSIIFVILDLNPSRCHDMKCSKPIELYVVDIKIKSIKKDDAILILIVKLNSSKVIYLTILIIIIPKDSIYAS